MIMYHATLAATSLRSVADVAVSLLLIVVALTVICTACAYHP